MEYLKGNETDANGETELRFEETPQPQKEEKKETVAEEPQPKAPLEANFLRSLSELMTADELTRKRVAELLRQVAEGM